MMKRLSISLISLLAAMSSVHAEAVLNAQGDGVMVNQGAGFSSVSGETALKTGDLISIRKQAKGAAQLVYEDRCVVKIKPGDVMRVAKSSPCSFQAQANGAQPDNTQPADQLPAETLGGVSPGVVIVGGALVAGAVAGIVVATNSKSSNNNQFLPILPPPCASAGC